MNAKDGGPAFPGQPSYGMPGGVEIVHDQGGMSLRDYFAGQALTALLHNATWFPAPDESAGAAARAAYVYADAMLAAREAK